MGEFDRKYQFLVENVYFGLQNLNDGFDSEFIYYFEESSFETVLDRVETLGIVITGLEPWLKVEYYDVQVREDYIGSL